MMHKPVNFKLRSIARERELRERAHPAVMSFQQRTETQLRTGFTIDFTSYKSYYNACVINVYGKFLLHFHLHYQVIPKITCAFSKPYEVQKKLFN